MTLARLFAFLCTFLLSACSPLDLLNATVSDSGYRTISNQAYGTHQRQKLDIHLPLNVTAATDVVVFFYGGRWQTGNKEDYAFVAEAFTSQGFITVIPDYRLYPDVDWRDFIQDGAAIYNWVEKNIGRHHGNPRRIFLSGHSAGAHIAAMVMLDEKLREKATSQIKPCGFIGLAGPYDFLPFTDDDVKRVFSSSDNLIETQPIYYVDGSEAALLLLTGDRDTSVKPRNSRRLRDRMQRKGGKAEMITYKDIDHIDLIISLASPFRSRAPTLVDASKFIRETDCQ